MAAEGRRPAGPPRLGITTSPQAVDWATLEAAWARIGEHDVFDSVWMNDHLTDVALERRVGTGRTRPDRAWALDQAREAVRRGATAVMLGMPPDLGAAGVDALAREVAEPLSEALA